MQFWTYTQMDNVYLYQDQYLEHTHNIMFCISNTPTCKTNWRFLNVQRTSTDQETRCRIFHDDTYISSDFIAHRIHVWYICQHLGYIDGKCHHISHTWILWVVTWNGGAASIPHVRPLKSKSWQRHLDHGTIRNLYLRVPKNAGTPKSSILVGFSLLANHFLGTPVNGNLYLMVSGFDDFPITLGYCNECGSYERGV